MLQTGQQLVHSRVVTMQCQELDHGVRAALVVVCVATQKHVAARRRDTACQAAIAVAGGRPRLRVPKRHLREQSKEVGGASGVSANATRRARSKIRTQTLLSPSRSS